MSILPCSRDFSALDLLSIFFSNRCVGRLTADTINLICKYKQYILEVATYACASRIPYSSIVSFSVLHHSAIHMGLFSTTFDRKLKLTPATQVSLCKEDSGQ